MGKIVLSFKVTYINMQLCIHGAGLLLFLTDFCDLEVLSPQEYLVKNKETWQGLWGLIKVSFLMSASAGQSCTWGRVLLLWDELPEKLYLEATENEATEQDTQKREVIFFSTLPKTWLYLWHQKGSWHLFVTSTPGVGSPSDMCAWTQMLFFVFPAYSVSRVLTISAATASAE